MRRTFQETSFVLIYFLAAAAITGQVRTFTTDSLSQNKNFIFSIGYNNLNVNDGARSEEAYRASAYPYTGSGVQQALFISIEKKIGRNFRAGMSYMLIHRQETTGSNWTLSVKNIPNERFDVTEYNKGSRFNLFLSYLVIPLKDIFWSRFEVAAIAGLTCNAIHAGAYHSYVREVAFSGVLDDTSAAVKIHKNLFGGFVGASLDFYLTRQFSAQVKLEDYLMPSFTFPGVAYQYNTTRSQVRLTDTRTAAPHVLKFSGTISTISFRWHI